jgi:hypothetical protein
MPMDVAERAVAGEHPIRAIREWRNDSGVISDHISQGYISGLESGHREGRVSALRIFARACSRYAGHKVSRHFRGNVRN